MAMSIVFVILLALFSLAVLVGLVLFGVGLAQKKRAMWITGIVLTLVFLLCCGLAGTVAFLVPARMNGFPRMPGSSIPLPFASESNLVYEPLQAGDSLASAWIIP